MDMDNIDNLEYYCSVICNGSECSVCEIGLILDKYHSTLSIKSDLYDEHLNDNLPF